MKDGFDPDDFQSGDQSAYFFKDSKNSALEYARHGPYENGVIEVKIPRSKYDQQFSKYEQSYQGSSEVELPIPQSKLMELNLFGRFWHDSY